MGVVVTEADVRKAVAAAIESRRERLVVDRCVAASGLPSASSPPSLLALKALRPFLVAIFMTVLEVGADRFAVHLSLLYFRVCSPAPLAPGTTSAWAPFWPTCAWPCHGPMARR